MLTIDDYSFWVLINYLVDNPIDLTLRDLARRIVGRDLFKMVPCSDSEVAGYFEKADAMQRLQEAVGEFCLGEPEYYIYHNKTEVKMLSESPAKSAYFIDLKRGDRCATPARDHFDLAVHWR
jgi:hypothetical protein